jgi:hypothetical protein
MDNLNASVDAAAIRSSSDLPLPFQSCHVQYALVPSCLSRAKGSEESINDTRAVLHGVLDVSLAAFPCERSGFSGSLSRNASLGRRAGLPWVRDRDVLHHPSLRAVQRLQR